MRDRGIELESRREDPLDLLERDLSLTARLWIVALALLTIFALILLSLPTKNGSSDLISGGSGSFLR